MGKSTTRKGTNGKAWIRCAIYTRKSSEEGLEQDFTSLDAQRESGEAYIPSQKNEGWVCLPDRYDDGGFTGGNMQRPALQRLLEDAEAGRIDCVVVYKVDRLSRSLLDFARMMEIFERHGVSFVSVTQQFNTATSMGRLMLNVLLSFAQFEREIISERTRDKMRAARRRGQRLGGTPVLGYGVDPQTRRLVVLGAEAERVRAIRAAARADCHGAGTGPPGLGRQTLDDPQRDHQGRPALQQGQSALSVDQRHVPGTREIPRPDLRRGPRGDRARRDV